MLLMPDRRKVAALIVGGGSNSHEDQGNDELVSCMETFLIATERKDPKAMADALCRFIDKKSEVQG